MTTVKFYTEGKRISGFDAEGHSGYACEGEDIVCAALSSVVQTAVLGLMSVVGIDINLERDDNRGYLKFLIPEGLNEIQTIQCDAILNTMLCGISDLYEGFSDFIELEVKG